MRIQEIDPGKKYVVIYDGPMVVLEEIMTGLNDWFGNPHQQFVVIRDDVHIVPAESVKSETVEDKRKESWIPGAFTGFPSTEESVDCGQCDTEEHQLSKDKLVYCWSCSHWSGVDLTKGLCYELPRHIQEMSYCRYVHTVRGFTCGYHEFKNDDEPIHEKSTEEKLEEYEAFLRGCKGWPVHENAGPSGDCMERLDKLLEEDEKILIGVDVARHGADKTVFVHLTTERPIKFEVSYGPCEQVDMQSIGDKIDKEGLDSIHDCMQRFDEYMQEYRKEETNKEVIGIVLDCMERVAKSMRGDDKETKDCDCQQSIGIRDV